MLGLIRWIIGFAITIVFVFFAAFNRQITSLQFSPLHDPIELPLYAIVMGFSALAFILGGLMVWMNDGKIRKERRGLRKTVKSLEKELGNTDQNTTTAKPENDLFPALTKQ